MANAAGAPLTHPCGNTIVAAIAAWPQLSARDFYPNMASTLLKSLERRIDELIKLCNQLDQENKALKADANQWRSERDKLIQSTDQARNQVEAMIQRLRALEQES